MFEFLRKKEKKQTLSKEEAAKVLKTSPKALKAFERKYAIGTLTEDADTGFPRNAKTTADKNAGVLAHPFPSLDELMSRIVQELLDKTAVWTFDGKRVYMREGLPGGSKNPVTKEEVENFPLNHRPQLTGNLVVRRNVENPSYITVLDQYRTYMNEKDPQKKVLYYGIFRQNLDVLDLDPVMYEIINMNRNTIGYWLPHIVEAADGGFFRIPATTVIKVPITLLQLTRLDFSSLNMVTLDIVNEYCRQAFSLDGRREYFIKTGIYSSKFDFRNAHVSGPKEVRELGEYLLFIHHQACLMAEPTSVPAQYGAATTNEWVVREYIRDMEDNPCIYHGLPLHTEYRLFVDFDKKHVIGINPYWDPDTMKRSFGEVAGRNERDMYHDFVAYSAHEDTMMRRYLQNRGHVWEQMEAMIQNVSGLTGQWSIDVMQNGDDFWIIDMALAQNSAFYNKCVPESLRVSLEEDWIPKLPEGN